MSLTTKLIGGFLLLMALTAAYMGWADHIGDVREAEVRAQYKAQAEKADATRGAMGAPIAARQAAVQTKIVKVFETIIKEVPTYVSTNDCPMSPGFRVFHDAAANGEVPDAARIADAAFVPADAVANTVAENYRTHHQTAARLTDLQDWVRKQQSVK